MLDAHIENAEGERVNTVEHGEEIRLRLELEATRRPRRPRRRLRDRQRRRHRGLPVRRRRSGEDGAREVGAGQRVKVAVDAARTRWRPGRYFVHCGINRAAAGGIALYVPNAIDFVVFGGPNDRGIVSLPHRDRGRIEDGEEQR